MLLLFIPLAMLRSVSEEVDSGLSARFTAAGGNIAESIFSKLIIAFIMTAIPTAAVLAILRPGHIAMLLPVLAVGFLFSFALFLFIGFLSGKTSVRFHGPRARFHDGAAHPLRSGGGRVLPALAPRL